MLCLSLRIVCNLESFNPSYILNGRPEYTNKLAVQQYPQLGDWLFAEPPFCDTMVTLFVHKAIEYVQQFDMERSLII